MAPRTIVVLSTEALLQLLDCPAMLSKSVRIGTSIRDAVILDAHPDIAQIYGYERPELLRGQYLSYLHDRTMFLQIFQYVIAQRLGIEGVPDTYDIRIHLPNGRWRWVRKQKVHQIIDGDEFYWVSTCVPIPAAEARPLPRLPVTLSADVLQHFLGWGTVADAEALISTLASLPSVGPSRHPPGAYDTMAAHRPLEAQAIATVMTGRLTHEESFEIPLGDLEYRRWVHRCRRCRKPWIAETANPKKCNHCKSPYWNKARERPRRNESP